MRKRHENLQKISYMRKKCAIREKKSRKSAKNLIYEKKVRQFRV